MTTANDCLIRFQHMLAARAPKSVPDASTRALTLQITRSIPAINGRPKGLVSYAQFAYGVELDEAAVRGAMAGW